MDSPVSDGKLSVVLAVIAAVVAGVDICGLASNSVQGSHERIVDLKILGSRS